MRLGFTISLAQTCKVCQEILDDEKRSTTAVVAAIFGADAYAICPSCSQEPANHHDRNYRARARRFIARRLREV
jgi:hypothetical protein